MQNTIIKGRDNPVTIELEIAGNYSDGSPPPFDRFMLTIGNESYDTALTDKLSIELIGVNSTLDKYLINLVLIAGDTGLDDGYYRPDIIGYSITYPNGYVITNDEDINLSKVRVL